MSSREEPMARDLQRYARLAGILGLVSVVAGGFGEAYVPANIVAAGNATATAANIASSEWLMRWGFAAYLVEATCDVTLTLLFYGLLRIVHKDAALLAAFFRLIGTAGFAVAQVFFFSVLTTVVDGQALQAFTSDQLNAIALWQLRMNESLQTVFTMFYGIGTFVVGYLLFRSALIPSIIAALVMISAAGFIMKAVTWIMMPAVSSPLMLAPAGIAFLVLSVWLVVKGVDVTPPQKVSTAA